MVSSVRTAAGMRAGALAPCWLAPCWLAPCSLAPCSLAPCSPTGATFWKQYEQARLHLVVITTVRWYSPGSTGGDRSASAR